jgi:hypothetical protein
MKSRKGAWSFVKVPLYPTITREERMYWRAMIDKIMKIGIEYEMNLPDRRGSCRGTSTFCACTHIQEGCWKECVKQDVCRENPHRDYCENSDICDYSPDTDECKGCKKFKFVCPSTNCIDFLSKCHICESREVNCDKCPERYDPNKDPEKIRRRLTEKFEPTQNFSKAGKFGIWSVTSDGSLKGDGGLEVITVGRKFHFNTFYKMNKEVVDATDESGAYLNERCGIHMHVLNGYYEGGGSELEIPMPRIILANLIQIIRKFHPALVWLTSALGESMEHFTRWEKFRLSMLKHSPMTRTLNQLKQEMASESKTCGNTKYHFMNIQRCGFNGQGDVTIFHVEFRFPDSVNCPLIITSQAAMFYALVMKAVDFSQFGLLEFASSPDEKRTIEKAFEAICNGRGDPSSARFSNTENAASYHEYYKATAYDLLEVLKPPMIDCGPAYDILRDLVDTPVALRKIQGAKDKDVEKDMERFVRSVDQDIEERIMAAIDLALYYDCRDIDEWITLLVQDIREEDPTIDGEDTARMIKEFIESAVERHEMVWNGKVGTLIARNI